MTSARSGVPPGAGSGPRRRASSTSSRSWKRTPRWPRSAVSRWPPERPAARPPGRSRRRSATSASAPPRRARRSTPSTGRPSQLPRRRWRRRSRRWADDPTNSPPLWRDHPALAGGGAPGGGPPQAGGGAVTETDRVVGSGALVEDDQLDTNLRPRNLDEYVGQEQVREQLGIQIEAAKRRGEPVEHVLLAGPPGLGKTTLAYIIGNELGVSVRTTSGPAIDHAGALGSILMQMADRDVFFIDEIHRLNRIVEESLYPALEDFTFDTVLGKGVGASAVRLPLQRFTCVGATTRQGLLSAPLRDRFGAIYRLDFYTPPELEPIVPRAAA